MSLTQLNCSHCQISFICGIRLRRPLESIYTTFLGFSSNTSQHIPQVLFRPFSSLVSAHTIVQYNNGFSFIQKGITFCKSSVFKSYGSAKGLSYTLHWRCLSKHNYITFERTINLTPLKTNIDLKRHFVQLASS